MGEGCAVIEEEESREDNTMAMIKRGREIAPVQERTGKMYREQR